MSVIATIEPNKVEVEPGGSATATVRVRNQSARVDGFRLEVVGETSGWATIQPPVLQLFPRTDGEATVTFRPPRATVPRAGSYAFGIRVQSVSDPETTVVEEGDIVVRPFVALQSALGSRIARGWRSGGHGVTVTNAGNAAATVTAKAVDPDEELRLSTAPDTRNVDPGTSARFQSTVRRPGFIIRGSPKRWPYSIQISEPSAGTEALSAVFEQRPLVPGWLIVLAGLALAAVVALIAVPGLRDTLTGKAGIAASATPSATQAAGATQAAVATPSGGSTQGAGEPTVAATEPPPTTAPTPEPPTLVIEGVSPLAGQFPATAQWAFVGTADLAGHLYIQGTHLVNGTECNVRVVAQDSIQPGTYAIGSVEEGAPVIGDLTCGPDDPSFRSTSGTFLLDSRDPAVQATFAMSVTDGTTSLELRGEFRNAPIQ